MPTYYKDAMDKIPCILTLWISTIYEELNMRKRNAETENRQIPNLDLVSSRTNTYRHFV